MQHIDHQQSERHTARTARQERRGVVSIVLVVGLTTVLAAVALAVNAAWLVYHRNQIRSVCEASALAGVGQMFDQSPIASGLHGRHTSPDALAVLTGRQDARAREQAVRFGALNVVARRPMRLDANWDNNTDGDLVTGWVDDPTALGAPLLRWQGRGPLNSMVVQTGLAKSKSLALSLWAAGMFSFEPVEMTVSARATVDQRVFGFRPAGHVSVPMVPLMIQGSGGNADSQNDADQYRVDPATGRVSRGRDGLAEFTIYLGTARRGGGSAGVPADETTKIIHFGKVASGYGLRRQILSGLTAGDLELIGGAVLQEASAAPSAIGFADATTANLASIRRSLSEIVGQKRIWPTGDHGSSAITGFTAARVVGFQHKGPMGQLAVVLQPCVLHTCTALVCVEAERNPRIGKVCLTQ